jgi:hypothetical protein
MKRLLAFALAALSLLACPLAYAADKPLVMESGQVKQLPAATALQLQAATTGNPTVNEPQGTSPTSLTNGDRWTTSGGFFGRAGGVTYGPFNSGTLTSVTCGSPLTGGTFTTTGTCSIASHAIALSYLAQPGGNSYAGNTSSSTGDLTYYTLPACTASNQALHYTLGTGFSCASITGVAGGTNPFYIGTPNIQSGCDAPSSSADPIGSLYLRNCIAQLYQQVAPSSAVPGIVQSASAAGTTTVTLGAVPTIGDFLVAGCFSNTAPSVASGWTEAVSSIPGNGSGAPGRSLVYKQVVSGDTTSQTPCAGANTTVVFEISGLANWAGSYVSGSLAEARTNASGSMSVGYTIANNSTLALGFFDTECSFTSGDISAPTLSSPTGLATTSAHAGSNCKAVIGQGQFFASSGASNTASGSGSGSGSYVMVVQLKPPTIGWKLVTPTWKNAGSTLTAWPLSVNCSTGLTCTTDGLDNLTLVGSIGTVTTTGSPATGNLAKFSGSASVTNGDLSGDCTTSGTLATTCTKTSGTSFGTFATQNYATPPAIGGTTPAAGSFTALTGSSLNISGGSTLSGSITTGVTGATQCLHVNSSGVVSGSGTDCGSASGAAISGTPTAGNCASWLNATTLQDAGAACGGGGGSTTIVEPGGRLTLVSGAPVMTSDQTAKSTVYYTCKKTKYVPYYDGSTDQVEAVSGCEVSLTMQTSGTGVTNSAGVFDVWWAHGGANRVCVATDGSGGGWASDTGGSNTARGTGYSQVHNTRGYITNVNSITHCYNGATDYGSIAADRATYLGSLYTTGAGQTGMAFKPTAASGGTNNVLGLCNAYNLVLVHAIERDNNSTWNDASTTWRGTDNSASNRITYLDCLGQTFVKGDNRITGLAGSASAWSIGIARDSTTVTDASLQMNFNSPAPGSVQSTWSPSIGVHFVQGLERAVTAVNQSFFGLAQGDQAHTLTLTLEM